MPSWSDEQRQAFTTSGKSLLVSAAAGSGKTATLTKRCIHLACEVDHPCDISQMLVVTYTEAAAAEMKGRISAELQKQEAELLQSGGNSLRLTRARKQLALLPAAQISTLHACCASLLRRHFQLVSLDPDFAVMDEHESLLLKRDVIDELLEEQFQNDTRRRFADLIDLYADGNVRLIGERIVRIHDILRSVVNAGQWRGEAINRLREVDDAGTFFNSNLGRRFKQLTLRHVLELLAHGKNVQEMLRRIHGSEPYQKVAQEICERLEAISRHVEHEDWPAALAIVDAKLERRGQAKECVDLVTADQLIAKLKKAFAEGDIRRCLACTPADMRADIICTIIPAAELLRLVDLFGERYQQTKAIAHRVDFADLEHLTLRLLADPGNGVAAECRSRFAYVMVDEFQDLNEVQWTILRQLCRPDDAGRPVNLFCVGDVKQSIYRFRMADPRIFLAQEREARPLGQLIAMKHNFRSRKELLDSINFVFFELMQKEDASEIIYTADHHLDGKRVFPPAKNTLAGAPVELHVITDAEPEEPEETEKPDLPNQQQEEDLERVEREACHVAQWIRNLMQSAPHVLDRDIGYRPLRYSDIVILLRASRFSAIEYSRALSALGIPCFSQSRTGFFTAVETCDLLSILSLLDNQQQDIPLAAVLRNPVMGIPSPESAMVRIRAAYPRLPFHQAAGLYAKECKDDLAASLRCMLARLAAWRAKAGLVPVAELLWRIISETGYLTFCRTLPNGRQRVANVLQLHRTARQFAGFQHQGLYRLLQFLGELEEHADLGQSSPGEAGNAVQIMTVHAAKGLEFPVVILSEIGKRFNMLDTHGNILISREEYLAMHVANAARYIRYPSAASLIIKDALAAALKAEELRILYVAMTRAQEKLILVGSASAKSLAYLKRQCSPGIDAQVFRSADCFLKWLVPLLSLPASEKYLKLIEIPESSIIRPRVADVLSDEVIESTGEFAVDTLLYRYPHQAATQERAANSVTGLSKGDEVPVAVAYDDAEPASGGGANAGELAAARGVAMHRFLELLDFAVPLDGQLETMIASELISAEDAKLVDIDDARWLLTDSPVANLLKTHATEIVREIPMLDSMAPKCLPEAQGLDRVLLRGRIDAVVPTPAGMVVIDYKTDLRYPEPGSQRELAYRRQMELYRNAVARSGLAPVAGIKLVFVHARKVLEI